MVDAAESSSFPQSSAIAIPQRTKLIEEDGDDLKNISASPNLNSDSNKVIKSQEDAGTPLNSPWTFWFDRYQRDCTAAQYEANLRKLYTVTTIEGFWGVYNNIPDVGKIGLASYHLMRGERRPIWEDDCNVRGGYWKMRCSKDKTSTLWKELLLAIIGENLSSFVHSEDAIVGVSVSNRDRDDIIQVWNQDAKYSDHARVIEAIYDLDQELTLHNSFYKAHCDHMAFESGSKRPGQHPRKNEGFSHTPPSYGPRQGLGGSRDYVPPRFGSSPRQVFSGTRDAAR